MVSQTGSWLRWRQLAGDPVAYPYAAELTQCGSLRTYELVFASGSDQMSGTDWPILGAVAETLKHNSGMKIEIAGTRERAPDRSVDISASRGWSRARPHPVITQDVTRNVVL